MKSFKERINEIEKSVTMKNSEHQTPDFLKGAIVDKPEGKISRIKFITPDEPEN